MSQSVAPSSVRLEAVRTGGLWVSETEFCSFDLRRHIQLLEYESVLTCNNIKFKTSYLKMYKTPPASDFMTFKCVYVIERFYLWKPDVSRL